ncbi:MAG: pectate lyase [Prevotella sp.]|nr:pectate lyase [Prevotella sp.]
MKKALTTLILATITLTAAAQAPAFPGAEGHGRYATGGRGGTVVHVTNLNDSGTGSLRQAVSSKNRIVVFDVGGIIELKSDLTIKDNVTIAGQTAPYPGITLRYYTVRPGANNIIRFIRIRRGEEVDVNEGADALWQRQKTLMMIDHCSFSWSIDEVASFYDNNNFTMQWCTIGESLNNAGHGKGAHGYGGIWGGKLASFHHNMILHVNNRSPRFNGARYNWSGYTSNTLYSTYKWQNALQAENVDFRNCVIYNTDGCYGGPGGGQINMVRNYYKSGPAATVKKLTQVTVAASGNAGDDQTFWGLTSRYHLDGNLIDNKEAGWEKFVYDSGTLTRNGDHYTPDPKHYYGSEVEYLTNNGTDYVRIRMDEPAPTGEVTTHTAANAYEKVLGHVGASLYRDAVDERYVEEARTGTAKYKGSITGVAGRIDKVKDQGTYTLESTSRPAGFDTDGDGMPDDWEVANGLNPNSAADGKTYTLDSEKKWYTNLEVYLNSLVEHIMKAGNEDALSTFDEYYPAWKSSTGISSVTTSTAASTISYYNMQGQHLATPPHRSPYIRVQTFADGHRVSQKVME